MAVVDTAARRLMVRRPVCPSNVGAVKRMTWDLFGRSGRGPFGPLTLDESSSAKRAGHE